MPRSKGKAAKASMPASKATKDTETVLSASKALSAAHPAQHARPDPSDLSQAQAKIDEPARPPPRPIQIKTSTKSSSSTRPSTSFKAPARSTLGLYHVAQAENSASSTSKRLTLPQDRPTEPDAYVPPPSRLAPLIQPTDHGSSSSTKDAQGASTSSRAVGPRSKIKPLLPVSLMKVQTTSRDKAEKEKAKLGKEGRKDGKRERGEAEITWDDGPEEDGYWDAYGQWIITPQVKPDPGEVSVKEAADTLADPSPAPAPKDETIKKNVPQSLQPSRRETSSTTPQASLRILQQHTVQSEREPSPPNHPDRLYPRQYVPPSPPPPTPSPPDTSMLGHLDTDPSLALQQISQARPASIEPIARPRRRRGRNISLSASESEASDVDQGRHRWGGRTVVGQLHARSGIRRSTGKESKAEPTGSTGRTSRVPSTQSEEEEEEEEMIEIHPHAGPARRQGQGDDGLEQLSGEEEEVEEKEEQEELELSESALGLSEEDGDGDTDRTLSHHPTEAEQLAAMQLLYPPSPHSVHSHSASDRKARYGLAAILANEALVDPTPELEGEREERRFIAPARNALKTPTTYAKGKHRFIPVPAAPSKKPIKQRESSRPKKGRKEEVDSSPVKRKPVAGQTMRTRQNRRGVKEDTELRKAAPVLKRKRRDMRDLTSSDSDSDSHRIVGQSETTSERPSRSHSRSPPLRSPSLVRTVSHKSKAKRSMTAVSTTSAPRSNQQAQLEDGDEEMCDNDNSEADCQESGRGQGMVASGDTDGLEVELEPIVRGEPGLEEDPEDEAFFERVERMTEHQEAASTRTARQREEEEHEEEEEEFVEKDRRRGPRHGRRHDHESRQMSHPRTLGAQTVGDVDGLAASDDETIAVDREDADHQSVSNHDRDSRRDRMDPGLGTQSTPPKPPSTIRAQPQPYYDEQHNPYADMAGWSRIPDTQVRHKEADKKAKKEKRKKDKQTARDAARKLDNEILAAEVAADLRVEAEGQGKKARGKKRVQHLVVTDSEADDQDGEETGDDDIDWDAFLPREREAGGDVVVKTARGRVWLRNDDFFDNDDEDGWQRDEAGGWRRLRIDPHEGAKSLSELADPAAAVDQASSYWATRKLQKKEQAMPQRKRRKREHSPYGDGAFELDLTRTHSAGIRAQQWAQRVEQSIHSRRHPPNMHPTRKRFRSSRAAAAVHIHPSRTIDTISWAEHNQRFDAARAFPVDTRLFQATVDGERQMMYEVKARRKTARLKRRERAYLRPADSWPSMGSADEDVQSAPPTQYTSQTRASVGATGRNAVRAPPRLHFTSREPTPGRIVAPKSPRAGLPPLTFATKTSRDAGEAEEGDDLLQDMDIDLEEGDELPIVPPPPNQDRIASKSALAAKPTKRQGPPRTAKSPTGGPAVRESDDAFDDIFEPDPSLPASRRPAQRDTEPPGSEYASVRPADPTASKAEQTTPKSMMMNGLRLTETMMDQLQRTKDLFSDLEALGAGRPTDEGKDGEQELKEGSSKRRKKPSGKRAGKEEDTITPAVNTLDQWLQPINVDGDADPQGDGDAELGLEARAPKMPSKRKDAPSATARTPNTPAKRAKWEQLVRQSKANEQEASSPKVQAITQPSSPIRNNLCAPRLPISDTPKTPTPAAPRARLPSVSAARVGLVRSQTRTGLLKKAPTNPEQGKRAGHATLGGKSYPSFMPGQVQSTGIAPTHVSDPFATLQEQLVDQEGGEEPEGHLSSPPMTQASHATARTGRSARSRSRVTSAAELSTTQRNTDSNRDDDFDDDDHDDPGALLRGYRQGDREYPTTMYDNEYYLGATAINNNPQDVNARYDQMYPHVPTDHRSSTTGQPQASSVLPASRQLKRAARPLQEPSTQLFTHQDTATLRKDPNTRQKSLRIARQHDAAVPVESPQGLQFFDARGPDHSKGSAAAPTFNSNIRPAPTSVKRKIGKSSSTFIPPRPTSVQQQRQQSSAVGKSQPAYGAGQSKTTTNIMVPRAPRRLGSCSQKAAAQYRPLTITGQDC